MTPAEMSLLSAAGLLLQKAKRVWAKSVSLGNRTLVGERAVRSGLLRARQLLCDSKSILDESEKIIRKAAEYEAEHGYADSFHRLECVLREIGELVTRIRSNLATEEY